MMSLRHPLLLLLAACIGKGLSANDSVAVQGAAVLSWRLPSVAFFEPVYAHPAAAFWRPHTGSGSVEASLALGEQASYHLLHEGEGGYRAGLSAEGISRQAKVVFWGAATYDYSLQRRVQWCDVAEAFRIGPYRIADSVGGDAYGEHYAIAGGLSAMLGRWTWAVEASYRAGNDYRKRDPRPKTIVSDLLAKASGSAPLGRYQAGLTAEAGIYQQRLSVRVMGSSDKAYFYAMRGFGQHDLLQSDYGASFGWQYDGTSYCLGAFVLPRSTNGWFVQGKVGKESIESMAEPATANSRYPFLWRTLSVSAMAGYRHGSASALSELKLQGASHSSTGTERLYKYLMPEGASLWEYHLLSQSDKYKRRLRHIALSGLHERHGKDGSKWLMLDAGLSSFADEYVLPAYHIRYTHVNMQATAGVERLWQKASLVAEVTAGYWRLVSSDEVVPSANSIFARSMQPDLQVLAASPLLCGLKLGFDHQLVKATKWYATASASEYFNRKRKATLISLAIGCKF